MSERALLLYVGDDEAEIGRFRAVLEHEPGIRLVIATDPESALRIAQPAPPDLVVISHHATGPNGLALCAHLKREPALADTLVVLIVESGSRETRQAGLTFSVDGFLERPLQPEDIQLELRRALRHRALCAEHRHSRHALADTRTSLERHFERTVTLLADMLEMRFPGSEDRGRRTAELALQVAARFGVPDVHVRDLELAARLHEVGRMLSADAGPESGLAATATAERWRYVAGSHAVFGRIPGLEPAAELVEALFENWDGTGHPYHLQQGQIPLRSRILRVVLDLFARLEAGDPIEQALEELQSHAGTCYDPMVLAHLRAELQESTGADVQGDRRVVRVAALEVGMVLAEDLLTPSGMKLLARDTRLTRPTLDLILRRHADDPMVHGVVVRRD